MVTNDFVIADYLLDNSNCTIIHTGGAVCRENLFPVSGKPLRTMLRSLMIDQAFISASSWSVRGISTPAEDKVTVKRAIASASRQRVLVCDATKYGQVATWLAFTIKRVLIRLSQTTVAGECQSRAGEAGSLFAGSEK